MVIDAINNMVARKARLPEGVREEIDIAYADEGNDRQRLDVYYPENMTGPFPIIIYIHGGGCVAGDKLHYRQYGMTLAKEGYAVFNINYRLAPKHKNPSQVTDALAAVRWVRENGDQFYGNKEMIVLAGDSAGAYLAAFAACICTNNALAKQLNLVPPAIKNELKGVILFCGLFDLKTAATRKFPAIKSNIEMLLDIDDVNGYKDIDQFSTPKNITEDYPSVFISSGEIDGLHPESMALISQLNKKNIYNKALLFDKSEKMAHHAFHFRLNLPTAKQCLEQVVDFMTTVTK
jgi:acetyl esterase/lipase